MNVFEAKMICGLAWAVGFTLAAPTLIFFSVKPKGGTNESGYLCEDNFPDYHWQVTYQLMVVFVTNIIPFISISVMNTMIVCKLYRENHRRTQESVRHRKSHVIHRVTLLVILITSLYCLCWIPTHVLNTWHMVDRDSLPRNFLTQIIKIFSQALSYASSCVNPIVYTIISGSFQAAIYRQCPSVARRLFRNLDTDEGSKKLMHPRGRLGSFQGGETMATPCVWEARGDCGNMDAAQVDKLKDRQQYHKNKIKVSNRFPFFRHAGRLSKMVPDPTQQQLLNTTATSTQSTHKNGKSVISKSSKIHQMSQPSKSTVLYSTVFNQEEMEEHGGVYCGPTKSAKVSISC